MRRIDVMRIRKTYFTDHQLLSIGNAVKETGLEITEDEQLIIAWKEENDGEEKKENDGGAKSGVEKGTGKSGGKKK